MKTVALIPIKLDSKRLPCKNIKKFYDGTPLVYFIQKVCLESEKIDDTYIYCSDDRIQEYLLPDIKFLKRPEYLDEDNKNANDVIREFIKTVDAEIYVNAHATSPFATVQTINTCINKVKNKENDSAFCAKSVKSFLWQNGKPVNYDIDHLPRTQDLPQIYAATSIAYVFSKETFIKYGRRIGNNPYIHEVGCIEATDIDYPEDFEIANAIYKEIVNKGR